jgi:hypothetical protein
VAEQRALGVAVDRRGDADAGAGDHGGPVRGGRERLGQALAQPGGGACPSSRADPGQQHRELVTAEPGEQVVRAQAGAHPLGRVDEQARRRRRAPARR